MTRHLTKTSDYQWNRNPASSPKHLPAVKGRRAQKEGNEYAGSCYRWVVVVELEATFSLTALEGHIYSVWKRQQNVRLKVNGDKSEGVSFERYLINIHPRSRRGTPNKSRYLTIQVPLPFGATEGQDDNLKFQQLVKSNRHWHLVGSEGLATFTGAILRVSILIPAG